MAKTDHEPERYAARFEGSDAREIDAFRHSQPVPPSKSEVLRVLVRAGLQALRGERLEA